MAKKKKKASQSRRVSGAKLNPKSPVVQLAAVAAGFLLAAKPINEALDKAIGTKVDSKIIGAGQIGLGAVLMFKAGKPSLVKTIIGGVVAGAGIKRELTAFGLGRVGGYGKIPVVGQVKRLGGYGNIPVVGNSAVGSYATNSSVGSYKTNSSVGAGKVMGSASNGSGSGLMR